jgi:hypothetical protein
MIVPNRRRRELRNIFFNVLMDGDMYRAKLARNKSELNP